MQMGISVSTIRTLFNKRFPREPSCDPSKRLGPAHMLSREPGSTVTDEETGAQKKTPRRKLALVKQPYEESTYDSFWPELNLNCLHALAVEDYAYEIESHMRSRPSKPLNVQKSTSFALKSSWICIYYCASTSRPTLEVAKSSLVVLNHRH